MMVMLFVGGSKFPCGNLVARCAFSGIRNVTAARRMISNIAVNPYASRQLPLYLIYQPWSIQS